MDILGCFIGVFFLVLFVLGMIAFYSLGKDNETDYGKDHME